MKLLPASLLLLSAGLATSCAKDGDAPAGLADTYTNATILKWNEAATIAINRTGGLPPMIESRVYAMVNVAVHDALNHIVKKYNTYALTATADEGADPDAAVVQAAHDIIAGCLPPQQAFADSLLNIHLTAIATGTAKDKGIALGKSAAVAMLAKRAGDGATTAQYPIVQGTAPGMYQSTPPFTATGYAALPGWGKLTPFALSTAAQYRPAAPYAINSPQYTADYNEIKTMGGATGSARTADQTQIGLFWLENIPYSWNRIARILIAQQGLNGWETARLLALVQMAEADANIACLEAKFFYNYWRPITAVRQGDADGNADTGGDASWNVLAPPTPPVPDYPSNHAADGGAAAELLKRFFGRDDFNFSTVSTALPGITRTYTSISQAATEVSLSRIYVGYHFRNAVVAGEDMGRKIGKWVFENSLLPVK